MINGISLQGIVYIDAVGTGAGAGAALALALWRVLIIQSRSGLITKVSLTTQLLTRPWQLAPINKHATRMIRIIYTTVDYICYKEIPPIDVHFARFGRRSRWKIQYTTGSESNCPPFLMFLIFARLSIENQFILAWDSWFIGLFSQSRFTSERKFEQLSPASALHPCNALGPIAELCCSSSSKTEILDMKHGSCISDVSILFAVSQIPPSA